MGFIGALQVAKDVSELLAERQFRRIQETGDPGTIRSATRLRGIARVLQSDPRGFVDIAGGTQMGFLSSVGKFLGRAVGAITGLGRRAAPVVVQAPRAAARAAPGIVRRFGPAAAAGATFAGAGIGVESLFGDADAGMEGVQIPALAGRGGNGRTSTFTIVLSVDNATGTVLRQEVRRGRPHIMNRDISTAKRVFRAATKLGARLPKKRVQPSKTKMLMDQVVDNALDRAVAQSAVATVCPSK